MGGESQRAAFVSPSLPPLRFPWPRHFKLLQWSCSAAMRSDLSGSWQLPGVNNWLPQNSPE